MRTTLKKLLCCVLALTLMLSNMCVAAFAASNEFSWTATSTKVSGAEHVKVSVTKPASVALAAFTIELKCDTSVFELVESGDNAPSGPSAGALFAGQNATGDGYSFVWYHTANVTDAKVLDFYLKVKSNVVSGDYEISMNCLDAFDLDENGVSIAFADGGTKSVAVTGDISVASLTPTATVTPKSQTKVYESGKTPAYEALSATYTVTTAGSISYQWYKNGSAVSGATSATYTPDAPAVGATDTYCVKVTNTYGGKTYTGTSNEVTVTQEKATVNVSACAWNYSAALPYTGKEQTVELTSVPTGVTASYTGNTATAVGSYSAQVSFTADANYNLTGSVSKLSWKIVNADLTISGDKAITVYNNQIPVSITDADVKATTVDGSEVTVTLAEKSDSKNLITISNNQITATGKGTGTATVTVTFTAANHNKATAELTVTVSDKIDVSDKLVFTAKNGPDSYEELHNIILADYVSELDYSAVSVAGTPTVTYYLNGKVVESLDAAICNAGTYTVTAVYADDLYSGSKTIEFTVAPTKVDVPVAVVDLVYTGAEQSGVLAGANYAVTGNTGANAGTYTAKVTLIDTTNYIWADGTTTAKSVAWSIAKAKVDVSTCTWSYSNPFTYTGDAFTVTLTNLPDGLTATYSGNTATKAGEYTASVVVKLSDSRNYEMTGTVSPLNWVINKAKVDASSVTWSYTAPISYTGSAHTVEVTGLPAGVKATYTGNTATNAGEYTAEVVLTCVDSVNCEVQGTVAPLNWKIEKATAGNLSDSVTVRYSDDSQKTFTAAMVETLIGDSNAGVTLTGVTTAANTVMGNATLADGVVSYALNSGLSASVAGSKATVTIGYTADNYTNGTVTLTVEVIDKNDVSDKLTFADGSATYTGKAMSYEKAKVASGYKGTITYNYSGNMTDAGTYTVTATYEDDDNYGVATAQFVIKPASISISSVAASKEYDGTVDATLSSVTFSGLKGEDTVAYTVISAVYGDANVGSAKKVTYEIQLADSVTNYTLTKGTGSTSKGVITAKTLTVEIADIADQTYTGSALKPAVEVSFLGLLGEDQLVEGTNYSIKYSNNVNAGEEAVVTVTVKTSKNYTFAATTKNFTIVKANPVVVADNLTVDYSGQAIVAEKITGTATFNEKKITGTWSWVTETAGFAISQTPYAAVVLFTPDNANLNAVECSIEVTVVKGVPAGDPAYTAVYSSGKTLADVELTLGTLPEGGTIEWVVWSEEANDYVAADLSTEVKVNVAYTWRYTPADLENFDVKIGTATIYRYVPVTYYYAITVNESANGAVTADASKVEEGDVVTLTVTPANGYKLNQLVVIDEDGNAVELVEVSEGVYTFEMPGCRVSVTGSFVTKVAPVVFRDVKETDWFHDAVYAAYEAGLMNGVGDDLFDPHANTTRAMVMTILARLAGVDTTGGEIWYSVGRAWAMDNGVSDGTNPEQDVTREQIITMLYRFAGAAPVDHDYVSEYPDGAEVSEWAKDAMNWAISIGLIEGDELGYLEPKDTATRAELATMLVRYTKKVED